MKGRRVMGLWGVVFIAAVLLVGCGESAKPDTQAMHQAYERGEQVGRRTTETEIARQVGIAHDRGYRNGLRQGRLQGREATWKEAELVFEELEEGSSEKEVGSSPEYESPEYSPYEEESEYESGPPTTENFGEGNGYVVECMDGTLSDSGGIQGACSHHGGVR
jgi:hypothetical protein